MDPITAAEIVAITLEVEEDTVLEQAAEIGLESTFSFLNNIPYVLGGGIAGGGLYVGHQNDKNSQGFLGNLKKLEVDMGVGAPHITPKRLVGGPPEITPIKRSRDAPAVPGLVGLPPSNLLRFRPIRSARHRYHRKWHTKRRR